jgi:hypothetical protein
MKEVAAVSNTQLNQRELELLATYFDLNRYPPQAPNYQEESERFKRSSSEVRNLLVELNGKYSTFNDLLEMLEKRDFSIDLSKIPDQLRNSLAWALGAHETSGASNNGFLAKFNGFVFPAEQYDELVQNAISKIKSEGDGLSPALQWDQIQKIILSELKKADSQITDQQKSKIRAARVQLKVLSGEIEQKELRLVNHQRAASTSFLKLKGEWMLLNRARLEQSPAFRDCANFELF